MSSTETYCQSIAAIHVSHNSTGYQVSSSKLFVPEITAKKPSKLAWTGSDLTPIDYIVSLNDDDLSDIKSAIRDFKGVCNIPAHHKIMAPDRWSWFRTRPSNSPCLAREFHIVSRVGSEVATDLRRSALRPRLLRSSRARSKPVRRC